MDMIARREVLPPPPRKLFDLDEAPAAVEEAQKKSAGGLGKVSQATSAVGGLICNACSWIERCTAHVHGSSAEQGSVLLLVCLMCHGRLSDLLYASPLPYVEAC